MPFVCTLKHFVCCLHTVNISNKDTEDGKRIQMNELLVVAKMVRPAASDNTPKPRGQGRNRAPVSITPFLGHFEAQQDQIGYCCGLNKYTVNNKRVCNAKFCIQFTSIHFEISRISFDT